MRKRAGRISFVTVILLLLIGTSVSVVYRFGPYYWDYWQMKEVTKTAVHTWKVVGRQASEDKLVAMIDDKNLAEYIDPSFCEFSDFRGSIRVHCSWEVDVYYPFSEKIRTLAFQTEHEEEMDG
jgi:hypothetical protein